MDTHDAFIDTLSPSRERENAPSSQKHVQTLRSHYQEMVRLRVFENRSYEEIAERFGMSEHSVQIALRSPIVKEYEAEIHAKREALFVGAEARLAELMPIAAETLAQVLKDETPVKTMDKVKVAQDVLDRAGLGRTTRTTNLSISTTLSPSDLSELKERARVNAGRRGLIIDVTPSPSEAERSEPNPLENPLENPPLCEEEV